MADKNEHKLTNVDEDTGVLYVEHRETLRKRLFVVVISVVVLLLVTRIVQYEIDRVSHSTTAAAERLQLINDTDTLTKTIHDQSQTLSKLRGDIHDEDNTMRQLQHAVTEQNHTLAAAGLATTAVPSLNRGGGSSGNGSPSKPRSHPGHGAPPPPKHPHPSPTPLPTCSPVIPMTKKCIQIPPITPPPLTSAGSMVTWLLDWWRTLLAEV